MLVFSDAAIHYAKSITANAAGEGQMDDRIGRLAAFGGDRAATEQAVRNVERQPFAARRTRCTPKSWNYSARPVRTNSETATLSEFGSVCVSCNEVTTARSRRSTATARLMRAAAALTGAANGHPQEQTWESASGEIAGAILRRSHQI
ncbi:MAG: hypothetical protein AB7S93_01360 [Xanthobacteraceae bacterium]